MLVHRVLLIILPLFIISTAAWPILGRGKTVEAAAALLTLGTLKEMNRD